MLFRPQRLLTFANFASRPGSVHARAEGIRLATCRYPSPFPLLILAGRERTGKTHLMHAIANMAKNNEFVRSTIVLSGLRFAEEVQTGIAFGDLSHMVDRFAKEDLLAVDDVDELIYRPKVGSVLLEILLARAARKKRSVLTITLTTSTEANTPLSEYLDYQPAVRLS